MTNDMVRKVTDARRVIQHIEDSLDMLRTAQISGNWEAVRNEAERIANDSIDLSLSIKAIA